MEEARDSGPERHPVDAAFVAAVRSLTPPDDSRPRAEVPCAGVPRAADMPSSHVHPDEVVALFRAQVQSRHLDFAARWLQAEGEGFYTIGSAGHEANAAVGIVTRVDDPALLHYRSGGFYAARAARHARERPGQATDAVRDVLLSLASSAADPISGGRHKVFGHAALHVIPQTSTIASHLPRAVGLALSLGSLRAVADPDWPQDAIVVCSLGDASVNHSTAQGALNTAAYLAHRELDVPLLLVCEDNGIGISTRTPAGWTERTLRSLPGVAYVAASDPAPSRLLPAVREAVDRVRASRRPAILHLTTVRFLGHAGSDVELAYRTQAEIAADLARDPLLATARHLVGHGVLSADEVLADYEHSRAVVMAEAKRVVGTERLRSREEVMRPLAGLRRPRRRPRRPPAPQPDRARVWGAELPEHRGGLTLAQSINAALTDLLAQRPDAVVLGEDVARKGGVYGVTRGLRRRFGGRRVIDTLLDEQTVLGTSLGLALAGALPLPEIQYLAYLHNAEDQLRGEAASLPFFSDGQYANPMVVRIAGLAYQKGFGGHFHNDNSVAVLRDVPGLVLCVPSHPADAPGLLRECVRLATEEGRVCVFLEPIALYHAKDLHAAGDRRWTAAYAPPPRAGEGPVACQPGAQRPGAHQPGAHQPGAHQPGAHRLGSTRLHGTGRDLLVVTFGNGVPMAMRAARTLGAAGVGVSVLDLRWLAPLPEVAVLEHARGFPAVLVADETRASGGVADAVVAALARARYRGRLGSVSSADSFVPLGPAADAVLLGEDDIVAAAAELVGGAPGSR